MSIKVYSHLPAQTQGKWRGISRWLWHCVGVVHGNLNEFFIQIEIAFAWLHPCTIANNCWSNAILLESLQCLPRAVPCLPHTMTCLPRPVPDMNRTLLLLKQLLLLVEKLCIWKKTTLCDQMEDCKEGMEGVIHLSKYLIGMLLLG